MHSPTLSATDRCVEYLENKHAIGQPRASSTYSLPNCNPGNGVIGQTARRASFKRGSNEPRSAGSTARLAMLQDGNKTAAACCACGPVALLRRETHEPSVLVATVHPARAPNWLPGGAERSTVHTCHHATQTVARIPTTADSSTMRVIELRDSHRLARAAGAQSRCMLSGMNSMGIG